MSLGTGHFGVHARRRAGQCKRAVYTGQPVLASVRAGDPCWTPRERKALGLSSPKRRFGPSFLWIAKRQRKRFQRAPSRAVPAHQLIMLRALLSSWPGRRGARAPHRKQTSSPMSRTRAVSSSPGTFHVGAWQTPPLSTPHQEPFGTARDGDGDWRGLAVPSTRPSTWVSSLGLGLRLRVVQDYGGQY
jgi:hypothetical protein